MATAVFRLCVFSLTFAAKRKFAHCYSLSVIRQGVDYCISRSAVDTAYKGVAKSAIVFVFKLTFTLLACCNVGCDKWYFVVICAVNDCEFVKIMLADSTSKIAVRHWINLSNASFFALATIDTLPPEFLTSPPMPSSFASRRAVGRKPIPCTIPEKVYLTVMIYPLFRVLFLVKNNAALFTVIIND